MDVVFVWVAKALYSCIVLCAALLLSSFVESFICGSVGPHNLCGPGMALSWDKTQLFLCIFGFLKEFRPSENFITQYLLGPDKNFTKSQLNQEIYPVGTYSSMSLLVVVFLLTDWARYKPVIVIEGLAGTLVYGLLIWGVNIATMQAVEFFYGLFMATDVAYKTYMYAICDIDQYQSVSASVHTAVLVGRFISGVISQISVSLNLLSYHQLNFLTLGGMVLSVPFALLLPSVEGSLYFHNTPSKRRNQHRLEQNQCEDDIKLESNENGMENVPLRDTACVIDSTFLRKPVGVRAIIEDFINAYSKKNVVQWSFWWSLGTCGYLQVTSYIQMLWQVTVEDSNQELLNGAIDAAYTIIGTLIITFIGRNKANLQAFSSLIIIISCVIQGILLLICSFSHILWVQYSLYVIFKVLYHSVMVFASAEVAKSLPKDSNALVFGFNTFVALCLQTILTLVVAGKGGLRLKIRDQFCVYGGYFIVMGLGFSLSVCISMVNSYFCSSKSPEAKDHSIQSEIT